MTQEINVLLAGSGAGGVFKSGSSRAAVASVENVGILEIEETQRLREFADRTDYKYLRLRATPEAIAADPDAARIEQDQAVGAVLELTKPTVVDVGANSILHLLAALETAHPLLDRRRIRIGLMMLVTAEHKALLDVPLMLSASQWLSKRFLIRNAIRGPISIDVPADVINSDLPGCALSSAAHSIYEMGGLACIPRLDFDALATDMGAAKALRVMADLERLYNCALKAVRPAATWLAGIE